MIPHFLFWFSLYVISIPYHNLPEKSSKNRSIEILLHIVGINPNKTYWVYTTKGEFKLLIYTSLPKFATTNDDSPSIHSMSCRRPISNVRVNPPTKFSKHFENFLCLRSGWEVDELVFDTPISLCTCKNLWGTCRDYLYGLMYGDKIIDCLFLLTYLCHPRLISKLLLLV